MKDAELGEKDAMIDRISRKVDELAKAADLEKVFDTWTEKRGMVVSKRDAATDTESAGVHPSGFRKRPA